MELIEIPGQAMIVQPGDRAYIEPADESVTPVVWRNESGRIEVGTRELVDLQVEPYWASPDEERAGWRISCRVRDSRMPGVLVDDPDTYDVRLISAWVGFGSQPDPSWVQAYDRGEERISSFDFTMRMDGAPSPGELMTLIYRVQFGTEGALMGSHVLTSSVTLPARPPALPNEDEDSEAEPVPGDGGGGGLVGGLLG